MLRHVYRAGSEIHVINFDKSKVISIKSHNEQYKKVDNIVSAKTQKQISFEELMDRTSIFSYFMDVFTEIHVKTQKIFCPL